MKEVSNSNNFGAKFYLNDGTELKKYFLKFKRIYINNSLTFLNK
jgi:hypothetical protein